MRVAIYQRWLATLGGGERYAVDLARSLAAAGHTVELLTHQPIELERISQHFALDLAGVRVRLVADSPGNMRLAEVSASYDLLINASHGDLFAGRATCNLLLVNFPLELDQLAADWQPAGGPLSYLAPTRLRQVAGAYAPEAHNQQSWTWTGEQATFEVVRQWPWAANRLEIASAAVFPAELEPPAVQILVDDRPVGRLEGRWQRWSCALPYPVGPGQSCTVTLKTTGWTLREVGLAADDRLRGVPISAVTIYRDWPPERRLRRWWQRLPARIRHSRRSQQRVASALASYDQVIAISQFVAEWIERRWGKASKLLYPAVDIDSLAALPKQPVILSVGRFFIGAHNKKHIPMIEAFRALCDGGLAGWEYHLAGGCDLEQPEQREYLDSVQAAAAGYPITLHINATAEQLRQLYGSASIFWHAAGFGEDDQRHPEAAEHFGIATVEAMAASCVPVVINKAGQREIVEHGLSGLRWNTLAELQQHTLELINDQRLWRRLAGGAFVRSRSFHPSVFAQQLEQILEQGSGIRAANS